MLITNIYILISGMLITGVICCTQQRAVHPLMCYSASYVQRIGLAIFCPLSSVAMRDLSSVQDPLQRPTSCPVPSVRRSVTR